MQWVKPRDTPVGSSAAECTWLSLQDRFETDIPIKDIRLGNTSATGDDLRVTSHGLFGNCRAFRVGTAAWYILIARLR
jgi:hypothetical protein